MNIETDELLEMKEAASYLHMTVGSLYHKTCRNEIPHYKPGKRILFKKAELELWLETKKVK